MPRKPRRQSAVEHTRTEILWAAARALVRRGLEDASVHEIAKEAGYTTGSLYNYFSGKQHIIEQLVQQVGDGLLRPFRSAIPASINFRQRLELVLREQLAFAERRPEALVLFFALRHRRSLETQRGQSSACTSRGPGYVSELADWISRSSTREERGGHAPEVVAQLLKGVMHAVFCQWLEEGARGSLEARAAFVVEFLLGGLSAAPRKVESSLRKDE